MPGNPYGYTYKDFLQKEYKDVYEVNYRRHLLGAIRISKVIASQKDIYYYNILFKGYSKAILI